MTRDEQKMITEFLQRAVQGAPGAMLPPLDIEADAIIRALFVRNPEAAYRVTMLAIAQARELDARRDELAETHARISEGWFWRLFRKNAGTVPPGTVPPGTVPPGSAPMERAAGLVSAGRRDFI